jgi:threo-3-hydroxy-L-aspartate ammonia-lyase
MEAIGTQPVRIDDVRAAAARIAGRVHRTPLLPSRLLDRELGVRVVLKAEHLQRTGAFKARGAFNALLTLDPATRTRGVIAVSSGNHGAAVALAAAETGTSVVVVTPEDASPAKLAAIRDYGAEVINKGVAAAEREQVVRAVAAERGLHLVHPFDDPHVIAGQGTAALELVEELAAQGEILDAVLVPTGGGGLLAGTATAVKALSPSTRVIGVEPETGADARDSLRAGHRVALPAPPATLADAVRTQQVGERPFAVMQALVDDIVTVGEQAIVDALALVWSRTKQLIEPTSALPIAALATGQATASSPDARVGVILSGGNLDTGRLAAALRPPRSPGAGP